PQDRSLGVPEHAVPGLLGAVGIRPGQLDRVLEVLVVNLEELERRALLADEVHHRDGPGTRNAEPREGDAAKRPDLSPGLRIDTGRTASGSPRSATAAEPSPSSAARSCAVSRSPPSSRTASTMPRHVSSSR